MLISAEEATCAKDEPRSVHHSHVTPKPTNHHQPQPIWGDSDTWHLNENPLGPEKAFWNLMLLPICQISHSLVTDLYLYRHIWSENSQNRLSLELSL